MSNFAPLKAVISINVLTGIGYLSAGWLGSLLASPPSNASPIWPAAGVALACMLAYGASVIPGIFIAAMITQFYAFYNASDLGQIDTTLLLAVSTGFGSTLQAWVGMRDINCWVGKHDALILDWKIIRFFILIALSCVVSPTVGISCLYFRDVIVLADVISSWATWWVGDAIGAMVFTPLILLFIGRPQSVWKSRRRSLIFPMLFILLWVVMAFVYSRFLENQRLQGLFERQTTLLQSSLEQYLNEHIRNNATAKAFFENSEFVTGQEFAMFAEAILKPYCELLEWIPRIKASEVDRWENANHARIKQLNTTKEMIVAQPQEEYFPVTYVSPGNGNEDILGLDIGSHPKIQPLIRQAALSGQTLATGVIRWVRNHPQQHGILIYSPIYEKNQLLDSEDARKRHLVGFVSNLFSIENNLERIFQTLGHQELQLWLSIHEDEELIFSNLPTDYPLKLSFFQPSLTRSIDFAGRRWQMDYYASDEFFHTQSSQMSWWVLLGGFFLCGLTGFSLLMLTARTARVEGLVDQRTQDLSRMNQALNQELMIRSQHENELRIAATTFESHEAIVVTDADRNILRVNKAFTQITGYGAEEVIGKNPKFFSSGYHDQKFYQQMYQELNVNNQWKGEIWNRRKNGQVFPELLTITGVRDKQNQLTHYVAIFSDVSAQKEAEKQIHHLAFFDPLTSLPNRRLMLDRLQHEIAAAKRQQSFGALFFMDLDHFKHLNDSRGHQVGDELLILVAQRLTAIIRNEDTACRLGGDEFLVMIPGRFHNLQQATNHAALLAEKILLSINQPYLVQGNELHFSSSIGITIYPDTADQPEVIIQQADTAMYRAKESGRNSICFFRPVMQESANHRLTLEKDMRKALQENQFLLHFQPQVNSAHEIISAEALIRWQHPVKGMISPAEFIPLAEDTQLILPIGNWVLTQTCRQIRAWDEQGHVIGHVAVNVSSRQFRQAGFVSEVKQALLNNDLKADRLVIELTEGCVVDDIEDTIAKMQALQAMGIKISIDDFGTGYSSLSYLKSLPLSQLKIDQSFVRHIEDTNAAVIVETIIMMAQSLGLNVIAEGVENQAQVDFLTAKGCLFFQGYYFSRPVPPDQFRFKS